MEPIPPTRDAIDEYGPFSYEGAELLPRLRELSDEVVGRVPSCVGLSLSVVDLGVTFTLVSTDERVAALDAVQYVDDGPCVRAIDTEEVVAFDADQVPAAPADWSLFARASQDRGIRSTLSLPVVQDDRTVGGFNLYGSTEHAFDDHHDELAEALGAWAGGVLVDRDLDFRSREVAGRAPEVLRDATRLVIAQQLLGRARGLTQEESEQRLRRAATRAGVTLASVVDTVMSVLGDD